MFTTRLHSSLLLLCLCVICAFISTPADAATPAQKAPATDVPGTKDSPLPMGENLEGEADIFLDTDPSDHEDGNDTDHGGDLPVKVGETTPPPTASSPGKV